MTIRLTPEEDALRKYLATYHPKSLEGPGFGDVPTERHPASAALIALHELRALREQRAEKEAENAELRHRVASLETDLALMRSDVPAVPMADLCEHDWGPSDLEGDYLRCRKCGEDKWHPTTQSEFEVSLQRTREKSSSLEERIFYLEKVLLEMNGRVVDLERDREKGAVAIEEVHRRLRRLEDASAEELVTHGEEDARRVVEEHRANLERLQKVGQDAIAGVQTMAKGLGGSKSAEAVTKWASELGGQMIPEPTPPGEATKLAMDAFPENLPPLQSRWKGKRDAKGMSRKCTVVDFGRGETAVDDPNPGEVVVHYVRDGEERQRKSTLKHFRKDYPTELDDGPPRTPAQLHSRLTETKG